LKLFDCTLLCNLLFLFLFFSRTFIVSQLQPLDARKVFPSFDEPNLKARFSISIEHQNGINLVLTNLITRRLNAIYFLEFRALSNMEEIKSYPLDKRWTRTDFDTTPIMATYILAFVISDFEHISGVGPNDLKVYFFCLGLNRDQVK
jgi:aminopeptidase N